LARAGEGRDISLSTNPRNDLARSIEDLKVAVDVLNALVAAKLAGGVDTVRTAEGIDRYVSASPIERSGLPPDVAHLDT